MEVRAAATRSRELSKSDATEALDTPTAVASAGAVLAAGSRRARRPSVRARVMNREDEYRYIRDDMIRLVLTASVLLVLMLVVLFIVEA
ncbi:MAG: hypothetical protein ACRDJW_25750 [Thermomicrobiales bacterium]